MSGQHAGPAHEGNSRTMGMHADEKSDGCIVPVKPRTMPSDIGGGDGGGKAAGRGEGELRRMLRTQRRNRTNLVGGRMLGVPLRCSRTSYLDAHAAGRHIARPSHAHLGDLRVIFNQAMLYKTIE